jgi:hypothetical protein
VSYEAHSNIGMAMQLSIVEIMYQAILKYIVDLDPPSSQKNEVDLILKPIWVVQSSCFHKCLNDTLPSDESIIEAMSGVDRPWENIHHISYFLSGLEWIEHDECRSTLSEMVSHIVVSLDIHGIYVEGNMVKISPTIMIDISRTPGKIENVYINADCTPEEIQNYTDLFK